MEAGQTRACVGNRAVPGSGMAQGGQAKVGRPQPSDVHVVVILICLALQRGLLA